MKRNSGVVILAVLFIGLFAVLAGLVAGNYMKKGEYSQSAER